MAHTLNYYTGFKYNKNVQPSVVMDNMLQFLKQTGVLISTIDINN